MDDVTYKCTRCKRYFKPVAVVDRHILIPTDTPTENVQECVCNRCEPKKYNDDERQRVKK